jgi:N-acetylneuraminate synthase
MAVLRSEKNLTPGLHPRFWDAIMGRTTVRPIRSGCGITWDDLMSSREDHMNNREGADGVPPAL